MNQMESFLRVFEIKEIDWNNGPTFGTLRRSTQEVPLKQAIKYCNYDIEWDIPCIGHYLEHRKALEFDIRFVYIYLPGYIISYINKLIIIIL